VRNFSLRKGTYVELENQGFLLQNVRCIAVLTGIDWAGLDLIRGILIQR
jgi:hypothetical protein